MITAVPHNTNSETLAESPPTGFEYFLILCLVRIWVFPYHLSHPVMLIKLLALQYKLSWCCNLDMEDHTRNLNYLCRIFGQRFSRTKQCTYTCCDYAGRLKATIMVNTKLDQKVIHQKMFCSKWYWAVTQYVHQKYSMICICAIEVVKCSYNSTHASYNDW